MVEWQVVAVVILVIALALLSLLIFKLLPAAKEWSKAVFGKVRYTFCCDLLGCTAWYKPDWSKLNPLCPTVCFGVCG
jgi:hypothetical protein